MAQRWNGEGGNVALCLCLHKSPLLRLKKLIFVVAAVKSITFRACACLGQYLDLLSRPVKVCHLFPGRWWLMMPSGNWGGGVYSFSLLMPTWTATAQLRKDEDWRDKIKKNEKSRSLKCSCYHILERQGANPNYHRQTADQCRKWLWSWTPPIDFYLTISIITSPLSVRRTDMFAAIVLKDPSAIFVF